MTREEAIDNWIKPALKNTWNDKKCEEVLKALEQEPCDDAISRQAALEPYKILENTDTLSVYTIRQNLADLPPVQPQPKTGHWIEHERNGIAHIECSECLTWFLRCHLLRNSFCPNCGAKMESEG